MDADGVEPSILGFYRLCLVGFTVSAASPNQHQSRVFATTNLKRHHRCARVTCWPGTDPASHPKKAGPYTTW
jgi:hypothetical protein